MFVLYLFKANKPITPSGNHVGTIITYWYIFMCGFPAGVYFLVGLGVGPFSD